MNRRNFLAGLAPLAATRSMAAQTAVQRAGRLKITSLRVVRLKVIKETGSLEPAWNPGTTVSFRAGGGSFVEIRTDQGLTGIGPGIDLSLVPAFEAKLKGKDPFDTEQHMALLRYDAAGGVYRGPAQIDIALWDLIGKACGQPIYKLIGGGRDHVTPYASMVKVSTPDERAAMAADLMGAGWKAIKLRLHNATMREDIRTVETVRAKVGDEMKIMIDANQAQSPADWQPGVLWDFRRAVETARELQRLNCVWLEEPLPRYAFDRLGELNRLVEIPIAGGENSRWLHEYLWMLQQGVYDILQPETMAAEGITGMRRVATLAQAFGRQITPHCALADLGTVAALHLVASFTGPDWLEIIHDPPVCSYRDRFSIFRNPPMVDGRGQMAVPQGPGLGVEIDPDLIAAA
jgi:L-alanine-DL-glutamate epimerase-like enolase superfamily enzyme